MKETKPKPSSVYCDSLPYFLELRGLSCPELEKKCRLEKDVLAMQCTGKKRTIPLETAEKVAEILEITVDELGRLPCHNLRFYCDQRSISCSELEDACNMKNKFSDAYDKCDKDPRNTDRKDCDAKNPRMTYRKIRMVAKALCVDIDDLGAPGNQLVDIVTITDNIVEALSHFDFDAITLGKVSKKVVFFLSMDHEEEDLKACIRYLIYKSNYLGRSLACSLLVPSEQRPLNAEPDLSNAMTVLKRFQKQQKLSYEAVGERLGVTRQTASKYLNTKDPPNADRIYKLSPAFNVKYYWLVQNDAPAPASMQQAEQNIRLAIKATKPKVLREMGDLILTYMTHWDGYMEFLLDCLLPPSSTKKEDAIKTLQDMMKYPLFYQEHHKPNIQIRYYHEEDEFYKAAVLLDAEKLNKNLSFFKLLRDVLSNAPLLNYVLSDETFLNSVLSALDETLSELDGDLPPINKNLSFKVLMKDILSDKQNLDVLTSADLQKKKDLLNDILLSNTIYPFLQLPPPFRYLPPEEQAKIPMADIDFPYSIEIESSSDNDDFESELFELAINAFLDHVSSSMDPPCLVDVLYDYFDAYAGYADLVEDIYVDHPEDT